MTELEELKAQITQLQREAADAKASLRRVEQRLAAVLDNSEIMVFEVDLAGTITSALGLGLGTVGREPGEHVGRSVFTVFPAVSDHIHRALAGETVFWSSVARGASLEAALVPLRDDAGMVCGTYAVVTNVTARDHAEATLRASEERFRSMIEKSAEAVALVSGTGEIIYTSPGKPTLAGRQSSESIGTSFMESVVPEDRDRLAAAFGKLLEEPEVVSTLEFRIAHTDGTMRVIETTSTNLLGDPTVGAIVVNSRDITPRKQMEAELRLREERYRRIIESTSEGVVITDRDGKITFVNSRFAEMLGYAREEMVGRSVIELIHPDWRDVGQAKLESRRQGIAEVHAITLTHKSGREVWVEVNANPQFNAAGELEDTIGLIIDHTERRRADEARKWHDAIVEFSDDAIIGLDMKASVISWNRGAERLYGYRADEIVGKSVEVLLPPDLAAEEAVILARLSRGENIEHYETTRQRKDGSLVDVSLTVSAIRDIDGVVVGVSKIARDLSERRKSEARLLRSEDQLRQAQKLEAVGSLAGGIAHDFNNLLSVILSYTSLALDEVEPGSPLHLDLEQIEQASERAAALTRQLLAFSRRQILEPQVIDLNKSLLGLEQMLRRVLGEQIELSLMLHAGVGHIYVDRSQLEQVVMNLVVNAHDAMPDGGNLTIETARAVLDEAAAAAHHGLSAGVYSVMAVTDTGVGMDAATVARIFEPFFTTKDRGKGTGLGLSTVFGIVRQSGGHIWVYSEPGIGTTFKVYMPESERPETLVDTPMRSLVTRALLPGHETILLVEDEDAVRATMRTILRRQGYHVIEAQNGPDALQLCEQYRTQIHLLLTDVVMPRMNGKQLAAQIASLRPKIRVLYVSGYTENTIVHHGILDAGIAYLQKPITPLALERKVREVLDG